MGLRTTTSMLFLGALLLLFQNCTKNLPVSFHNAGDLNPPRSLEPVNDPLVARGNGDAYDGKPGEFIVLDKSQVCSQNQATIKERIYYDGVSFTKTHSNCQALAAPFVIPPLDIYLGYGATIAYQREVYSDGLGAEHAYLDTVSLFAVYVTPAALGECANGLEYKNVVISDGGLHFWLRRNCHFVTPVFIDGITLDQDPVTGEVALMLQGVLYPSIPIESLESY